ncbi:MAG TPA: lipoprotein [Bacteroidales bacterium]|nr:lipoprotein [Bacteroidales bacterium]
MRKYFLFFGFAFFLAACGNQTNTSETGKEVETQEEEMKIVEKGSAVIDSTVVEIKTEVEKTETEVNELLKDI